MVNFPATLQTALAGLCLLLVPAAGYGAYRSMSLSGLLAHARLELASSTESARTLAQALTAANEERRSLADALLVEQSKNNAFENELRDLSRTVGTLSKLATTDPELLAKYSKVYFLNENYVPPKLSAIDPEMTHDAARTYQFHADALPFLKQLLKEASNDGMELQVISAYRSFDEQTALKSAYRITYGAGTANRFSAEQGYSEHQLGTAVDFTTKALGASFTNFEGAKEYGWLQNNAHRYGLIISYPKGNAYYMYEPWHWRFVGVELASDLHDDDAYFYELDQRTIQTYLAQLFDR